MSSATGFLPAIAWPSAWARTARRSLTIRIVANDEPMSGGIPAAGAADAVGSGDGELLAVVGGLATTCAAITTTARMPTRIEAIDSGETIAAGRRNPTSITRGPLRHAGRGRRRRRARG